MDSAPVPAFAQASPPASARPAPGTHAFVYVRRMPSNVASSDTVTFRVRSRVNEYSVSGPAPRVAPSHAAGFTWLVPSVVSPATDPVTVPGDPGELASAIA